MSYYSNTIMSDSPVAYYHLNESSGLVAYDQTSNHYNATLPSGCTYSQVGALLTDTDTAITLPAGGALTLPYQINITTWSAITVECWLMQGAGWNLITVTYTSASGGTLIYYLNGAVTSVATSGGIAEVSASLEFVGNYAAGTFDEVALYNTALSSTRVLAHYQAAQFHPIVVLPTAIRRDGMIPVVARRTGAMPTVARRDGTLPMVARRTGVIPFISRRDGTMPTVARRDGSIPAVARRTGTIPVVFRRDGTMPTVARRG